MSPSPGAYLRLEGDDNWWCDPVRLEILHYALGNRRLVAWSRSLSEIRRKLGFLKDNDCDTDEDLVDVGEDEDEEGWVPFREVLYRWTRNEQGRLGYHLWAIKLIDRFDADDCDHSDDWWDFELGGDGDEVWLNCELA